MARSAVSWVWMSLWRLTSEVVMAAWSLTVMGAIRVDILMALPVMGGISFLGGRLQSALAARSRSPGG